MTTAAPVQTFIIFHLDPLPPILHIAARVVLLIELCYLLFKAPAVALHDLQLNFRLLTSRVKPLWSSSRQLLQPCLSLIHVPAKVNCLFFLTSHISEVSFTLPPFPRIFRSQLCHPLLALSYSFLAWPCSRVISREPSLTTSSFSQRSITAVTIVKRGLSSPRDHQQREDADRGLHNLYLWCLASCLSSSRCLINICWINKSLLKDKTIIFYSGITPPSCGHIGQFH